MGMASVVVVPQARLPEADLYYSEALVDRELALGSTHPLTVLSLGNFAHQMASQEEKIAEAAPMLREELAAYISSFGKSHPNTLQATLLLARTLARLKQGPEAKSLVKEALAAVGQDASRDTGVPDPAAAIFQGAAAVLQLLGEEREADALLRNALQKLQAASKQGPASCGAALSACLALDKGSQKGPDVPQLVAAARSAWVEQALSVEPVPFVLGANLAARLLQPRTADSSGRIRFQPADCVLSDPGVLREAEPLLRQALDARRARLGAGHAHALTAQGNLAVCLLALGRAAEAEPRFREQLAGLGALGLGLSDPGVQECSGNVARSLEALGRLEEARDQFAVVAEEAALQEGATASGALLVRMLDLARVEAALGNAAEAEALLREVHDNCITELGFPHPCSRISTYALAQYLQEHDKLDQAEAILDAFREGSAPANAPEALEAEAPVCLSVVASMAGLLRALRA